MDTFSVLARKCLCCRQEKLLKIVLVNERYYGTKNLRHRFLCKISFQILIVEAGKSHVGIVKVQQKKSISKFLKLFRRRRLLQRLRTILKCSFFSAFVSGHHLQKANEFHIMFKRHAINMLDSAFYQVSPTSKVFKWQWFLNCNQDSIPFVDAFMKPSFQRHVWPQTKRYTILLTIFLHSVSYHFTYCYPF